MSTATIGNANIAPPTASVWLHLLWKDFRQIRELVIGVILVEAAIQLMLGLLELSFPTEMARLSHNVINIALSSPTLMAIACSGVLIGQERQTGSWTWSTSLPVTWWQSLAIKTLVWVLSSVLAVAILMIVGAVALAMNHTLLSLVLSRSDSDTLWTYWMALIIAVQVFLLVSIATLLIKDTLTGVVIAASGFFIFHCFLTLFTSVNYAASRLTGNYISNGDSANTILLAYLITSILGIICLCATYRWRWGRGQYSSLSFFTRTSQTGLVPRRAAWQSYTVSASQPSEFKMLMYHGIRNSLALRLAVFCTAMFVIFSRVGNYDLRLFAIFVAAGILGISVFSGDQTLSRYRFFADRGVDWRKLLVCHTAFPVLLLLTLLITVSFQERYVPNHVSDSLIVIAICVPIFVVGMFSSLVFPNPIVSITVAFVALFAATAMTGSALAIWQFVAPGHDWAIMSWIPVATLLVLIIAIRQIPRWLTVDRFQANAIYFCTMLAACSMPFVLGLTFGFLFIPSVPWQGTPLEQIKRVDWTGGPDLNAWKQSPQLAQASSFFTGDFVSEISRSSLSSKIYNHAEILSKENPKWLSDGEKLLDSIEHGGPKPANFNMNTKLTLDRMIEGSAELGVFATKQREKELAIRAWKANRKLIAFCQQPALLPATIRSMSFTWEAWITLNDSDLKFLSGTSEIEQLLPGPGPTMEQFREVLQSRATLFRIASSRRERVEVSNDYFLYRLGGNRYSSLASYPPIRWAYERQDALTLSNDLSVPNMTRLGDPLVHEFTVLNSLRSIFVARHPWTQTNQSQ